jgi:hypothetical protein
LTNEEKLAAAIAARHRLLMGEAVVECDFGEQRTKFTAANADRLDAYIAELEALIAGLPRRGAMGFAF